MEQPPWVSPESPTSVPGPGRPPGSSRRRCGVSRGTPRTGVPVPTHPAGLVERLRRRASCRRRSPGPGPRHGPASPCTRKRPPPTVAPVRPRAGRPCWRRPRVTVTDAGSFAGITLGRAPRRTGAISGVRGRTRRRAPPGPTAPDCSTGSPAPVCATRIVARSQRPGILEPRCGGPDPSGGDPRSGPSQVDHHPSTRRDPKARSP